MSGLRVLLGNLYLIVTACAIGCAQAAPVAGAPEGGQIAPGRVMNRVVCKDDPAQSYALYVPSSYTAASGWPMIYAFDPGGVGKRPVELYKDIAEKYGFVITGSNNSRNFSNDESAKSMSAMWKDTHSRLALDDRRIYSSGFSGGARVAGAIALACGYCQIAGVIAHGAGYPSSHKAGAKDGLLYFFAIGDRDFNWPEVTALRREREEAGLPYRVRTFSGSHQWAPEEVMEDALEWITLNAMRSGREAPKVDFIDRFFRQVQAQALAAETAHDLIGESMAYRTLVSDFRGLKEVAEYENKLASLKKSADFKAALKREQDEMAQQAAIENEIGPQMIALAEGRGEDLFGLRTEVTQKMSLLKSKAEQSKNTEQRLVAGRAFGGLWVEGLENGQQEFEARHFERAETYFQLISRVSADPWPMLLLAETHSAEGNKKQALQDLREAVRRGLKDPEVLENDDKLQKLKAETEFQKIIAELRPSK